MVDPKTWSPEQPHLYDVRLELLIDGQHRDVVNSRCAFRDIEVRGDQLFAERQAFAGAGILNWGYAPPDVCPSRDPEFWKQEIALLRSYGFNLMKFCLWVPPRGYLELADEMGVLTWMEYPHGILNGLRNDNRNSNESSRSSSNTIATIPVSF